MAAHPIYTSLTVPVVASAPSATAFQWSADGQACFLTKTALYIMTPDHGLNFEPLTAIKAKPDKDKENGVQALGWYRTLIQFDRAVEYLWPEQSQDWGAIVLGSVDIGLWAVTLSPSNLSAHASCIVAALSSSMDLTLWTAGRNGIKGEWIKLYDVTPFLLDHFAEGSNTVRALKSQVISMHWSQQADFGLTPAPLDNGSLLVAGNRAGMLLFLRYNRNSTVELAHTASVSDRWVVCLRISSWAVVEPGKCDAYIAYSTDAGAVGVVKVRQTLHETPATSPFGLNLSIGVALEGAPHEICAPDQRPCGALEWIESAGSLILIYHKLGVIHLWRSPHSDLGWTGLRTLPLSPLRLSAGMSPFHPVSGMHYVRRKDILLVCLYDGSFHVVRDVSSDPGWGVPPKNLLSASNGSDESSNPNSGGDELNSNSNPDFNNNVNPISADNENNNDDKISTQNLSVVARSIFTRVEAGVVDAELENRISAMTSYDGGATVAWVHEACRPADFGYKHDAKHTSIFLVARMWDDTDDEALLQDLVDVLKNSRFSSGFSPAHLLRPLFFHLHPPKLNHLHARILDILDPHPQGHLPDDHSMDLGVPDDHSTRIAIAPWTGGLIPEMRSEFRGSLARHLYGWDVILSLRMRLSLADFAWKASETTEKRETCGAIAQKLLHTISHRVLRTIMRHLTAAVQCLKPNDVPFVLRMVVQSLLPGSPADLAAEGDHLSSVLHGVVVPANSDPNTDSNISMGLNETCPACKAEVQLHVITSAVCPNGHTWLRCSITTFILSTPYVRTCVGCSRKAFLPLSSRDSTTTPNWLPEAGRGWVVEELLEAVHRCLFCGNSFVSVL
ncbi:putative zinc-finger of transcription factor IIIC complex-domain-containing protein [Mycena galopus ATCC 62051]|nr:putative zinc-finger of transcription factor IIIC complex-domain-containing protein [Mycena galopus ATCC 62051]